MALLASLALSTTTGHLRHQSKALAQVAVRGKPIERVPSRSQRRSGGFAISARA